MNNPENLMIAFEVLLVLFLLAFCVIAVICNLHEMTKIERNNLAIELKQLSAEVREQKNDLVAKDKIIKSREERIDDLGNDQIAKDYILVALLAQLDKDTLQQMIADLNNAACGNKTAANNVREILQDACNETKGFGFLEKISKEV